MEPLTAAVCFGCDHLWPFAVMEEVQVLLPPSEEDLSERWKSPEPVMMPVYVCPECYAELERGLARPGKRRRRLRRATGRPGKRNTDDAGR